MACQKTNPIQFKANLRSHRMLLLDPLGRQMCVLWAPLESMSCLPKTATKSLRDAALLTLEGHAGCRSVALPGGDGMCCVFFFLFLNSFGASYLQVRAAAPEGSGLTMKMMDGLATSSTPMVRRLRCSTLSPLTPGTPTSALFSGVSSISSSTCACFSLLNCLEFALYSKLWASPQFVTELRHAEPAYAGDTRQCTLTRHQRPELQHL